MEFDSPEVMKDFPGLYATESSKKCKDDSDFSDDAAKNELLIGRRKEKKDKKDKEKGYAALEGESSGDENSKSRSPSKHKKSKSFKFTTSKSKERRDKSREKEVIEKKKEKEKKQEKKNDKERGKTDKHKKIKGGEDNCSLADTLPIFGVSLDLAVERSKCHDGVDIPLPVRQCIDYLETAGNSFEGIYKVSGTKSKVIQIKKMFNNRENVDLYDYDVPTSTSLLKMFLRELTEPIFTNDLLIRFEEAGAILSSNTREKHLKILIDNLPASNKLLLSWLLIHLDNISLNERMNKMSKNNLGASLNHTFHVSSRLLTALINHSRSLFPGLVLKKYIPPLPAGAVLPSTSELIKIELAKQESLLNQIHMEMNCGCIVKQREELLWEVQRIITQLKRKMKSFQKEASLPSVQTVIIEKIEGKSESIEEHDIKLNQAKWTELPEKLPPPPNKIEQQQLFESDSDIEIAEEVQEIHELLPELEKNEIQETNLDKAIALLKIKNNGLLKLRESLIRTIQIEHKEIENLKSQINSNKHIISPIVQHNENLDKIMDLLQKENQILQIKKINLVRQIIEQQEICIDLKAKIQLQENSRL